MKENYIPPLVDIIQFQSATPVATSGSEHDNGFVDFFGLEDFEGEQEQQKYTPPGF